MTDLACKVGKIGDILNDPTLPLKLRFRALFTLRNIGGDEAISRISECFKDESALLQHELAYCLGQMRDKKAVPILTRILQDRTRDAMVRHEAGEAIGAIGDEEALETLKLFSSDEETVVAETCQLAYDRIKWSKEKGEIEPNTCYLSVDPAPPLDTQDVAHLKTIFLSDETDLFNRYRAMFSLRNLNSEPSVLALCQGLKTGGALFRHEVAFVLGQLQNEVSTPYLIEALEDVLQNEMVRHECAEALGSIASQSAVEALEKYKKDKSRVVAESCIVALDMADYELSSDFQYANTAIEIDTGRK